MRYVMVLLVSFAATFLFILCCGVMFAAVIFSGLLGGMLTVACIVAATFLNGKQVALKYFFPMQTSSILSQIAPDATLFLSGTAGCRYLKLILAGKCEHPLLQVDNDEAPSPWR